MAEALVFQARSTVGSVNSSGLYASINSGNFVASFNPNGYYLVAGQGVVSNLPNAFYRVELLTSFRRTSTAVNKANTGLLVNGAVSGTIVQDINAKTGNLNSNFYQQITGGSVQPMLRFTPPDGGTVFIDSCQLNIYLVT